MVIAAVVVLLMPDWTGTGIARPLWLFALPIALGIVGAVVALRTRHPGWALTSAIWGFALIQIVVVVITLVSGP